MERSKTYKLRLPGAHKKRYCGSSHGWLILLEANGEASLFNPMTRYHLSLPSISVVSTVAVLCLNEDVDWEAVYASSNLYDCTLEKMVLSSSPTSGEETIALALFGKKIAFCRPRDTAWTLLYGWMGYFTDAIYHEDKFYIIDCMGTLFTLEIGSSPTLKLKMPPPSLSAEDAIQRYVLEIGGDVLMICRIQHDCERGSTITLAFEVYKLDCSRQHRAWIELKSLGGYTVFIGGNCSVSVLFNDLPGFKKDCIYFTDDWSNTDEGCVYNDQGIYNLADESIEPLPCSPLSCSMYSTPKWLIPSF